MCLLPASICFVSCAVVYPELAGPAERLVDDVRVHVSNIFRTVVKFVYKQWPDVVPIILREVMLLNVAGVLTPHRSIIGVIPLNTRAMCQHTTPM